MTYPGGFDGRALAFQTVHHDVPDTHDAVLRNPFADQVLIACVKANDAVGAIDALTSVNGLGIVKPAFVVQMCGLDVACLDSHNLTRLGLSQSHFKLSKTVSHATKRKKIAEYVEYTRETGGAEYWWNTWCNYVAGNRANSSLNTGDAVSKYHVTAVMA